MSSGQRQTRRAEAVKDAYDPDYVFDLNHGIAPSRR